jgi:hypothetical protein
VAVLARPNRRRDSRRHLLQVHRRESRHRLATRRQTTRVTRKIRKKVAGGIFAAPTAAFVVRPSRPHKFENCSRATCTIKFHRCPGIRIGSPDRLSITVA